jgi:hypothetical protein
MDSHSTQSLYSPKWLNALLVFALLVVPVAPIQVIRTIYDQDGDSSTNAKVHYDTASWKYGPGCQECILKVNPVASAFHSSWHDVQAAAGGHESFTITFPGNIPFQVYCMPFNIMIRHRDIRLRHNTQCSPNEGSTQHDQSHFLIGWITFRSPISSAIGGWGRSIYI